jgi:hypothetical protein
MPVSTTEASSCPDDCLLKLTNSCYAKHSKLAIHWKKVTPGERGGTWAEFCESVAGFKDGQLWRHNQAGDLPGVNMSVDAVELAQLVHANKGKRGFTYTHKYTLPENLMAIRAANAGGFTINLSANTLAQADTLADTKAGPVVVILPSDQTANTATPAGRKVVVCPATIRDDVTCAKCGLCQKANRTCIVGFPAHGNGKAKATAVANS